MNAHSNSHSFGILSSMLEDRTGQTLLPNRHFRIQSSLQPIMREHGIPDINTLVSVIISAGNHDLETACLEAILNNETCFFRDQANFALLTGPVLDSIREKREKERKIRIWSSACSYGQEALSLAISIAENHQKWAGWDIEIIATDVSNHALNRAKKGLYNQFEIQRGLPIGLLLKYFKQIDENWQVENIILNKIKYRHFNMVDDSRLMGKFDLILCRNMLMYFGEKNKKQAFLNLEQAINPHGYIMLGASETVMGYSDNLEACSDFRGFYKYKNQLI